jgi:ribosome-binding factor A
MRKGRDDRPSHRTLKVGEAMRHVLAEMLARGDVRDPALESAIVSVSEVRVSPDLRHATAYVLLVGGDAGEQSAVLAALNAHARAFRQELARRVNTKYAADLRFRLDETIDEAARIDALLRAPRVARDLERPPVRRIEVDED